MAVAGGGLGAKAAANDRVQVGCIGTGARAHQLIPALLEWPTAEIVAVSDAYTGRMERAIERTRGRAKAHKDYREILADKSIDAVIIATPDHWHRNMVVEAIRAGKDVYCEKPLTYRSSEGVDIMRAAAEHKRIVQVGSQGMSTPLEIKAREIVQSGKLGKVTMIRAAFNRNTDEGAWTYPIPPDASPSTVDWNAFLGPAPKRPFDLARFFRWRCFRDYSGGIATDLFVHLCTTIHFVMNAKVPARVVAMGELFRRKEGREVPDTLNAILEYPEGFAVNLSSTFNNQTNSFGFEFLGTEGTIRLGDGLRLYPENAVEDTSWIVASWPRALEEAYYRDPKVLARERPQTHAPRTLASGEEYREEGPEGTILHFGHWLDSIRTRQPYWEDAAAGHRAAACAHMVNRSAAERRVVEWDYAADDVKP